jgi:molybdate transport system substrate-binding protein
MRSSAVVAAICLSGALALGAAEAAEIKVMYPPPLRTLLSELIPQFEQASGHKVLVTYESSWLLVERIRKGETPDVAFLTSANAQELIREGKLARRRDLVSSRIGLAVRAGAPAPDIATVEAFKRTLLAAGSFARNEGADSGKYMSGLLERLGIAEAMKPKTTLVRQGFVAALVARGEIELGAQQMPELMAIAGVEAFPLPADIQHVIEFCAATPAMAQASDAVEALIGFVASPTAVPVIKIKGLAPM